MFYSNLCKHGPARQNFGASASGVQLGRAEIVARRLVRVNVNTILHVFLYRLVLSIHIYYLRFIFVWFVYMWCAGMSRLGEKFFVDVVCDVLP